MPKVNLDPIADRETLIHCYIIGELKRQKITYAEMGDELGITQQGFSYKLAYSALTLEDILRIFERLKTDDATILRLMRGDK